MDIQAYISSGILESYVLGELSAAEVREVEEMAARYPQVGEELSLIEATLAGLAKAAAVPPRAGLKASILDNLAPVSPASEAAAIPAQEPPVRPLQTPASQKSQPQRWLMAASIGLALVSSLAAAYFWSRWQQTEEQLASLAAQNTLLVQHVSTLENRAEGMQQSLAVLTNPTYRAVKMAGLTPAPDALAVVYWNPATEEVYLHAGSLPIPPTDKQYQLWAIVDGKPVDAGVFDTSGQQLQKMKAINNASAFAVTLEPKGGSPSPTMEQMYVMGEAS
ncbi:MAG: anti-sigma factor [Bacteroidetes bacterium]|nr:anti-sigma factor [Bacteroidota bacterium]